MFFLAAAALATTPPEPRSATAAVAQATATIRIVAAVRLKLDATFNPDAPPTRDAVVRGADGTAKPAKLIEFQ